MATEEEQVLIVIDRVPNTLAGRAALASTTTYYTACKQPWALQAPAENEHAYKTLVFTHAATRLVRPAELLTASPGLYPVDYGLTTCGYDAKDLYVRVSRLASKQSGPDTRRDLDVEPEVEPEVEVHVGAGAGAGAGAGVPETKVAVAAKGGRRTSKAKRTEVEAAPEGVVALAPSAKPDAGPTTVDSGPEAVHTNILPLHDDVSPCFPLVHGHEFLLLAPGGAGSSEATLQLTMFLQRAQEQGHAVIRQNSFSSAQVIRLLTATKAKVVSLLLPNSSWLKDHVGVVRALNASAVTVVVMMLNGQRPDTAGAYIMKETAGLRVVVCSEACPRRPALCTWAFHPGPLLVTVPSWMNLPESVDVVKHAVAATLLPDPPKAIANFWVMALLGSAPGSVQVAHMHPSPEQVE
jgi:hypothetical protein